MSHASFRHAARIAKVLESGDMFMLKAIKKDAKSSQLATNGVVGIVEVLSASRVTDGSRLVRLETVVAVVVGTNLR